ncbi:hypothetical protein D3C80_2095260 [compost metagenome]
MLDTTIDESKYSAEYLDTPIAQLLISQPALTVPGPNTDVNNLQEQVSVIAKRLLRQSHDEVAGHV